MNENTEILIRELADKLGTTSEQLWNILITQAWIDGSVNLLGLLALGVALWCAFKFVNRKTTTPEPTESNRYPRAEWEEEGALLAWFLLAVSTVVLTLIVATEMNNVISAFVHPEYWALKEILETIGR